MVWRRLPSYFPSLRLQLQFSDKAREAYEKTGQLRELVFRTAPSVNKASGVLSARERAEIKAFLESVYGLRVEKVNTLNYEGTKKRGKHGFFRQQEAPRAMQSDSGAAGSDLSPDEVAAALATATGPGGPPPPPPAAAAGAPAAPPPAPGPQGVPQAVPQHLYKPHDPHSIYYVTYRDHKEVAPRLPSSKKAHTHAYVVKFYLVDNEGVDHLAAVGEDLGDAHYSYTNESGFPFLRARNRGEVEAWLLQQIHDSELRAGLRPETVEDAAEADPAHIRLPKFVGKDHEKQQMPDGGHTIHWFLIDELGKRHLAVVGRETHTHDGHYEYQTFGLFDQLHPLRSHNQRQVDAWADQMCFHGGVALPLGGGRAHDGGGPAHSAGGDPAHHPRLGRPPLGGSSRKKAGAAGPKHDLVRQATANAKRFKAAGGSGHAVRPADKGQEAREVVAVELRRWGQEEAVQREAAKSAALAYLTDVPSVGAVEDVAACLKTLKQAAAQPGFVGGVGARTPSHGQQAHLLEVLTALQLLGHCYAPLKLIATPELKETLAVLAKHRHPEVASLAFGVLTQWLATLVAQAEVLGQPRYVEDPRYVVEATLEDRKLLDPIVTAVTRRKLGGAVATGGAAGAETPGFAAARVASATPLGLSTMPSELSLPSLDAGAAVAGGTPGTGLHPATAERRRLHLDTPSAPAPGASAGGSAGNGGQCGRLEERSSAQLLDVPAQMDTEQAELVASGLA
eukprot:scaffold28.g7575.t1